MEVQDIFEDIEDPDPANDNQDPYAVCIRKLDHHFRAKEIIPFERHVFRQMNSATIIKCLDKHFARFGVPDGLRTDNGPNLVSKEMESYLEEMDVAHRHTTPLWPSSNGKVERRENRSLLKTTRVSQAEDKHWQAQLNKFLLAYRSTNHSTTGAAQQSCFSRESWRLSYPKLKKQIKNSRGRWFLNKSETDSEKKKLAKDYADRRNHVKDRSVGIGDAGLLEKRKENKLSASYESAPFIVTRRHGHQVVMQSPRGVEVKRNLQHVKPLAITDSDCNRGNKPDRPDQPSSPDHVDPNPQGQLEPTESVPTATRAALRGFFGPRELWKIMYFIKISGNSYRLVILI